MTTAKSRLTSIIVLAISAALFSGCGGKKSRTEKAAAQQAVPAQDITYPPTIVKPSEGDDQ